MIKHAFKMLKPRSLYTRQSIFFSLKKPDLSDFIQDKSNSQSFNSQNQKTDSQMNYEEEDEDKSASKDSHFKFYGFALGASVLLGLYFIQQINKMNTIKSKKQGLSKQKSFGKALIGGDWQLEDKDGNKLSSDLLKGSYYIIYFGFCKCPDICPQTLKKIANAVNKVKQSREAAYFDLKTVFVSIDPERDSPSIIKKYLEYFSPDIIGITGKQSNDPNLKSMLKKFKIYATRIEFEQEDEETGKSYNDYTLDHTIISYLISDENEYITHLGSSLGANDLAERIIDSVMENENFKMYK